MSMDPHELQRFNALIQKLDLVERKVDQLFRHMNLSFVDERPMPSEIERMIIAGDKIGAIRLHQSTHGHGLAEAKLAVDKIAARLGL
jgi:hypothetical protein